MKKIHTQKEGRRQRKKIDNFTTDGVFAFISSLIEREAEDDSGEREMEHFFLHQINTYQAKH